MACSIHESQVRGDFDGNGQLDVAIVGSTACLAPNGEHGGQLTTPWAIDVIWAGSAEGVWPLPMCGKTCAAYGAGDVDGNHTDELAVVVGSHGATKTIEVLEVPTRETGPYAFPAQTPHGPGAPLLLDLSVGPRHVDAVSCQTAWSGDHQLLATGADLSTDGTTWTLHQKVFGVVELSFLLESSRTFSEPAQPGGPYAGGNGCFVPYE